MEGRKFCVTVNESAADYRKKTTDDELMSELEEWAFAFLLKMLPV
ncbi:hypothetical protein M670_00818 [Schinkia azotoformans MEV2011]|uniref:Uncharacterized protein n=1 Tax=Schinkia azotoformans MEV2011 TaxID=1348973 RepID=A0A072NQN4_SCHAZ|nr:hypothetical protein [Schinkia azotoformans]KEF39796.1 hypothetical protein M670_00818 [Schinkia azotoformans MEV2011]MEC1697098.1 hypothetical protein [Schinkia azotoformans]MEC1715370.1 hypothetical protein [Schinkia azotoformans]MEC1724137.1 hypothetical protein [Schinkia azotoformans]MEC1740880.1 hypothetical protein [Schinkia azotoformans]